MERLFVGDTFIVHKPIDDTLWRQWLTNDSCDDKTYVVNYISNTTGNIHTETNRVFRPEWCEKIN